MIINFCSNYSFASKSNYIFCYLLKNNKIKNTFFIYQIYIFLEFYFIEIYRKWKFNMILEISLEIIYFY